MYGKVRLNIQLNIPNANHSSLQQFMSNNKIYIICICDSQGLQEQMVECTLDG